MAIRNKTWKMVLLCLGLFLAAPSFGFSLLGPFAPWMTPEVGFIRDEAYDVGGPRNLGYEFRWNVPALTYGFDESFKNFFGQPGIDAVEQAVAILNALPPASQIDLASARLSTTRVHATAQSAGLFNLKSYALIYLVEQMGIANPTRFTWIATTTNAPIGSNGNGQNGLYDFIVQRNFDPISLMVSKSVNNEELTFIVEQYPSSVYVFLPDLSRLAIPILIDQTHLVDGVAAKIPFFYSPDG